MELERYVIARKKRQDKEGGGLALLIKDNLKFQGIMEDGSFKQYLAGKVIIGKPNVTLSLNVLENFFYNTNEGTLQDGVGSSKMHSSQGW